MNHRHEDFQKRWYYLTQQYQYIKSQKQWCAIYCAIGCLFRPIQKHCVQHRKAAIDWLECFWRPFLFLFALTEFSKINGTLLRREGQFLDFQYLPGVLFYKIKSFSNFLITSAI